MRQPSNDTGFKIQEMARNLFLAKSGFFILLLFSLGIIFLLFSLIFSDQNVGWAKFLVSALREAATIFIVSGVWTAIYDGYLRQEIVTQTTEFVKNNTEVLGTKIVQEVISFLGKTNQLQDTANKSGLVRIFENADAMPDFRYIIERSQSLTICLNNGNSWLLRNDVGQKEIWLKTRFADPNKKTIFVFLHPESPFIPIQEKKEGKEEGEFKKLINQTVKKLLELKTPETKLEIWGHDLYNPYSLYMTEEFAFYSPFRASRGKTPIPMFQYRRGDRDSNYQKLKEDIDDIIKNHSQPIQL